MRKDETIMMKAEEAATREQGGNGVDNNLFIAKSKGGAERYFR